MKDVIDYLKVLDKLESLGYIVFLEDTDTGFIMTINEENLDNDGIPFEIGYIFIKPTLSFKTFKSNIETIIGQEL